MRTRDEIQNEMIEVADAMERPGLSLDQARKAKAKYAELESELAFLVNRERKEASGHAYEYPEPIRSHVEKIWSILDPAGKRRRKK